MLEDSVYKSDKADGGDVTRFHKEGATVSRGNKYINR